MKKTPLTNKKLQHGAVGDLQFSDSVKALLEVEKHFIDSCTKRKIFWSYDVTAGEPFYFDTLNYTTYAGGIIICPLQSEMALRQMYDATRNTETHSDFVSYFRDKVLEKKANKYNRRTKNVDREYEALVVLPGDNKIKTNICRKKLEWIIDQHGDNVLFKPHPLTRKKTINELKSLIGAGPENFVSSDVDLYEVLINVDTVYSSHMSESAMYSTVLNKNLSPIDRYETRQKSSFCHINYFLFNEPEPKKLINPMLSSYKSGFICPELEGNWKEKLDQYLDYILNIRELIKDHYV